MAYGMQSPSAMKEKVPSGYKKSVINTGTPEMLQLWQQLFSNLSPDSYLGKLAAGDQSMFDEMEAPALRQFTGLQGNIASKFSGQGMGGRHSSGFQNSLSAASSDFAQDLQSKRQQYQMDAIKQLMGLSGDLFNMNPYETSLVEKNKPWWQEALTGFAGGAGQGAGKALFGGF